MRTTEEMYSLGWYFLNDWMTVLHPSIGTKLQGFLRSRNLKGLATCSVIFDPAQHKIADFRFLLQIEALFKKNAVFTDKKEARATAWKTYLSSELGCASTNRRLEKCKSEEMEKVSKRAQSYIQRVLGDFHPFLESLPKLVKITSGATHDRPRKECLPFMKMGRVPCCTRSAAPYVKAILKFYGFKHQSSHLAYYNRVEFVPKSWKTERSIACEPVGNVCLQLAFDTYCKLRLKRVGIDLRNQEANRNLARQGSVDGSLATIDLSAASDSLSYNTVVELIPLQWLKYLDAVRSPLWSFRTLKGRRVIRKYHKFSSMGNGATFALETLVFAAICFGVGSKSFSVYGDDIIIESEKTDELLHALAYYGFSVNIEKSFTSGPFRESCGGNFFEGTDVTPFYVRNANRRKATLCHNVNGLASVSLEGGQVWDYLKKVISEEKLPLTPFSGNTLSGVHITPRVAYAQGILRVKHKSDRNPKFSPWVPIYKAYVPVIPHIEVSDWRGYFLWFLEKRAEDPHPNCLRMCLREYALYLKAKEDTALIKSRTQGPVPDLKYRRVWVSWDYPTMGIPVHAEAWTGYLLRSESCRGE
jgi:hypothetical protein